VVAAASEAARAAPVASLFAVSACGLLGLGLDACTVLVAMMLSLASWAFVPTVVFAGVASAATGMQVVQYERLSSGSAFHLSAWDFGRRTAVSKGSI
jgi:hypothetical protein